MQQAQQENHGDRRRRKDEGEQRTLRIDGIKIKYSHIQWEE